MTTLETSLTILAPIEVQRVAVPIMRRYGFESLIRMAPHLTLIYPFVPVADLADAARQVRAIAATFDPFEVTLRSYGRFPGVTYMQPDDPKPIQALFRAVFAAFPAYPPYNGQFGNDLTPHLTVGEFSSAAEQDAAELPAYEPLRFQVESVHLMTGTARAALPWLPYDVIPLKPLNTRRESL